MRDLKPTELYDIIKMCEFADNAFKANPEFLSFVSQGIIEKYFFMKFSTFKNIMLKLIQGGYDINNANNYQQPINSRTIFMAIEKEYRKHHAGKDE